MTAQRVARKLAQLLAAGGEKIVFAESCTGGLASATLTQIPGISAYHCGGVVVYRNETKMVYLGISAAVLKRPGAVSAKVAGQMALAILEKTPEATLAAAITGHLGPGAPADQDGQVFMAVARRKFSAKTTSGKLTPAQSSGRAVIREIRCPTNQSRTQRQRFAVAELLGMVAKELES